MKGKEQLQQDIARFETTFSNYYKSFLDYFNSAIMPNPIPTIGHPSLFNDAIQLQVMFYKLPEPVRNRLLLLDFEVFLHCNNEVDFYNLRNFLLNKRRYERVFTLAVRADAEIKLLKGFVENDIFDEYNHLPTPNFQFYRDYNIPSSLLSELINEKEEKTIKELEDNKELINSGEEVNSKDNIIRTQNNIYDEITKNIKKSEDIVSTSESFLAKSLTLIRRILEFKDVF